ncbi:MAG TPA: extracellular solute-binding protein, partial [Agromyces sp.]|nr:extracellular solute-binding protein [Agromyces sp.]
AGAVGGASVDGTVYGDPNEINTSARNYNTRLFEEAGISEPPATWEELIADAKLLTKKDGDVIMQQGLGLINSWAAGVVHPYYSLVASDCGDIVDGTTPTLAEGSAADVMALYEQLIQEGVTAPEPLDLLQSAQIYAYIVTGARIRDAVEAEVGALDDDTETITAIRRTTQPAGDERFPGSLKLPVLEIVGTGATEARAEDISTAATTAFLTYVTDEQAAKQIAEENRVMLEVLKEGTAVEAETSNPAIPVVVTGVAVFLAFVALAFIIAGLRSDRAKRKAKKEATGTPRRGRREAEPAETVPDDEPEASAEPDAEDADDHRLVGAGHRD